jgi:excisionase family DNA binding protein
MFNDFPDVVTIFDIQIMLGVCKSTAYKLVNDKQIQSVRVGKKFIIPKQAVINYLTKPSKCGIMEGHTDGLVISKEVS